ncbi:hypothetical protein C1886_22500 [Pseudomonas sp. FW300-N1A1]|nr:hypothetical protein C1886_22500 [Pseudomonas sp. FW300-N1A1]
MKKNTFWLVDYPVKGLDEEVIHRQMLSLIDIFNAQEPREGDGTQFKTIVVVFPDLQPISKVADLHAQLKEHFLKEGL